MGEPANWIVMTLNAIMLHHDADHPPGIASDRVLRPRRRIRTRWNGAFNGRARRVRRGVSATPCASATRA